MSFSQNLRDVMEEKKITAYRLSKLVGVHQTTIKNWLDGKTTPKVEMARQVADALDVPVDKLLSYTVSEILGSPQKKIIETGKKIVQEKINVASSANLEPRSGIFDNIKYFIGNSKEEENSIEENDVEKKGKPADLVVSEQEKELLDLIHKLTPEQKALVRSQIKGILFDQKL